MPILSIDESVVRAAQLNPAGAIKMLLRGLVTVIFGAVGCVIFGIVGSMGWPGYGAIVGAVTGLLIFTTCGCMISGFYADVLPAEKLKKGFQPGDLLPHNLAKQCQGGHGHFTLDLTVRKGHDVNIGGLMAMVRSSPYIEVMCGSNPVKRTCVDPKMEWNETFRIKITPQNRVVKIALYDQDLFGVTQLGEVTLDIEGDIMERLPDRHNCSCVKGPVEGSWKHDIQDPDRLKFCRPHKFKIERGGSQSIVSRNPLLEVAFQEVQDHEDPLQGDDEERQHFMKTYGTLA